jgi:hypothetical protein
MFAVDGMRNDDYGGDMGMCLNLPVYVFCLYATRALNGNLSC